MAIGRKITYNALSLSISKITSTALALFSIALITRYLGKEGFGNYATVMAFFSFFAALADLGLYAISTREISRESADENKIISNIFTLRIISSLVVMIITPALLLFLPYDSDVKMGIIVAAAAFVFSSGYLVLNGVFQKELAMHKVALAELAGKILQVTVIYYAVKQSLGFNAVISSLLFSMILNFVLVFIFSRRYIKINLKFDLVYWKKFLKHSLPVGIASIITFLYFKMDTILLSVIKGNAEVGTYNAAYKVLENLTFFPAMVVGLTLPLTSRYIFSNKQLFEKISNNTFKAFIVMVLPLVSGIFLLSRDVINVIGGPGFEDSAPVLRVLVFALFFIFFGNFSNSILLAGNEQKRMMKVLAICAAFNILANLALIPLFSYAGAAATSVATELLVVVLTFWLMKKKLHYFPKTNKLGRIIFTNLLFALAIHFLRQQLNIFLTLALASVIYVFLVWLTKSVTREELKSLFSKDISPDQPLPEAIQ
jgi:O-antigen/teichoic acid export membrane protein